MPTSRREFLRAMLAGAGYIFLGLPGCSRRKAFPSEKKGGGIPSETVDGDNVIAVASGRDPAANVDASVSAVGGFGRFVRKNDVVLVKPNIAWNRPVRYGANTDPNVVRAVIKGCLEAGAKEVRVCDRTCEDPRSTYRRSGIADAAREAGAKVYYVEEEYLYRETPIPEGKVLKSWPFLIDALEADVFINVPAAKHHDAAGLTLSIKNLMGILGGNRGEIHAGIHEKLVDLYTAFRPALNILDATRCLVRYGPQGSGPEDVVEVGKVIAGVNALTVDAYGAQTLPFQKLDDLPGYIRNGGARGLGEIEISRMNVQEVDTAKTVVAFSG